MKRAIVDTDVLAMGFLDARGGAARVVDAWLAGHFVLCCASAQLSEVAAVLKRAELASYAEPMRVEQFLFDLERRSERLTRMRLIEGVEDPASRALLGLAVAGEVDVLVVGDGSAFRDFPVLGEVKIRTAREFAVRLAAS